MSNDFDFVERTDFSQKGFEPTSNSLENVLHK